MAEVTNTPAYVLLAEDDDDDFFIFTLAVEKVPLTVTLSRAENGDILMQKLSEKLPDILFLDLLMPCKDGMQCIREIRADARYDELPVIVYSSMNTLQHIQFCYTEGANSYIHKPFSVEDLAEALRKIFVRNWKDRFYPPMDEFVINQ